MPAIRIEGLQKNYGAVRALDGLNLEVQQGKVFGFLGPNGAGKTTTLKILTGLAQANAGRAWIGDVEMTSNGKEISRRIGYLPEEPAFYHWMTPYEFLDHVGRVFSLSAQERESRILSLLETVGLADVRTRKIGGFSRGMRQRLGLAQAMINQPEVLLLDEPVSALDPAGRKELLHLIDQLRDHSTILMSTHILADVERVCDTIGVINHGRLVTQSPREELLSMYAVPAFALQADRGFAPALKGWAHMLQQKSWVRSVSVEDRSARVIVEDMQEAKRELLSSALDAGLQVIGFEILRPSLEDVFLSLVGEGADE